MKRRMVIFMVGLFVSTSLMTACGKKNEATQASSKSEETEKEGSGESVADPEVTEAADGEEEIKPQIAVLLPGSSVDKRWRMDADVFRKELGDKGYQVMIRYATGNALTQEEQILSIVAQERPVEAMVIAPVDPWGLTSTLETVSEKKIPVFSYDEYKPRWTWDLMPYLGCEQKSTTLLPKIGRCPSYPKPEVDLTITDKWLKSTYAWNQDCGYLHTGDDPYWHRRHKISEVKNPSMLVIMGELAQGKSWMMNWANESTNKKMNLFAHKRDSNYLRIAGNVAPEKIAESMRSANTDYFKKIFYLNGSGFVTGPIGN